MGQPAVHEPGVEPVGRSALVVHHGEGGLDQAGVGLVQDDEDVGRGEVERPPRLRLVVEAEDSGSGAPAEDPAARVEPVGERGEPEGAPALAPGDRVHPEPSFGDDAEGALAAHEQLGEVGAGGRPRPVPTGPDHGAVGQDYLEAEHHVLDLAVAVRVLAGPPAGQPPAHGGEVHRLGPVPERDAEAVAETGLDLGAEGAGPQVGHQRLGVDLADPGEPTEVEGDPPEQGDGPAAHPAPPACCSHRHAEVVAQGQHGGHLVGVGGADHQCGPGRDLPVDGPSDGKGPPVARRIGTGVVAVGDLVAHVGQPPTEGIVDRYPDTAEVVFHRVRGGVDRGHRCGPCHPRSDPWPAAKASPPAPGASPPAPGASPPAPGASPPAPPACSAAVASSRPARASSARNRSA